MRRSPPHLRGGDGGPAARTGLSLPLVHPEAELEGPGLPLGIPVSPVLGRRPPRADRLGEHPPDRPVKFFRFRGAHGGGGAAGMKTGAEESLVAVDVPQAGHGLLVEENGLDRRPSLPENAPQASRVEIFFQRLRPEEKGIDRGLAAGLGKEVELPELAGIGVAEGNPAGKTNPGESSKIACASVRK